MREKLTIFFKDKEQKAHSWIFIFAIVPVLIISVISLIRFHSVIDVLPIVSTLIIAFHWGWGASFYYYYFHEPKNKVYFLFDFFVIVSFILTLLLYKIYFLWALILSLNYIMAILLYKVKPASNHYNYKVKIFIRRKEKLDLIAMLLLMLGFFVSLINEVFLYSDFIYSSTIIITFILIVVIHGWVILSRFYSLD